VPVFLEHLMPAKHEPELRVVASLSAQVADLISQPEWPLDGFPGLRNEAPAEGLDLDLHRVESALRNAVQAIESYLRRPAV
jgi:hypothetical protein